MTAQTGRAAGAGPPPDVSAPPLLVADRVAIAYGRDAEAVEAVREVSFEMSDGERLMIVGPSGCGKSTLIRAVAGFQRPSGGRIVFAGREDLRPGPDRAMVFQELDQLFPWQTVLSNVATPLRDQGAAKADAKRRAEEHLSWMGLEEAAGRYPHELSGGMKQRVAIARALALKPRLLLMDEPFGSLDAITRDRLQQEVRALSDRLGIAMLFVTHSIDEAMAVGDRVLVLSPGPSVLRAVVAVPPAGEEGERARTAGELRGLLSAGLDGAHGNGGSAEGRNDV